MPFRRALFLGAALSIVAASAGFAQTVPSNGPDGPYVRVEGGWSHLDDANSTGSAAGPPHFKSMFDEGYIFGGAGGYKWGPWRAELNVDWSQNAVKKVQDNGGLGFGSPPANGDVDKLSFMINGYYDWITGTPWTPYIGLGFGAAHIDYDNVKLNIAGVSTPLSNDSDTVFAYQPMIGVRYGITDRLAVGVEYRFFGTMDSKFNTAPASQALVGKNFRSEYTSHNLLLNLTWYFGGAPAPAPTPAAAPPPPPPPAVAPAAPATPPVAHQVFIVFFEFDKSNLTEASNKVVDEAAAAFKRGGSTKIELSGYTDLAGTQKYNLGLSERRAETVRDALVQRGVPQSAIDVSWHGKENPRVPTADGVREPQNRRVEIVLP